MFPFTTQKSLTNVTFEQDSKVCFTAVRYNISNEKSRNYQGKMQRCMKNGKQDSKNPNTIQ